MCEQHVHSCERHTCRASPQPEVAKAAPELMRSLLYVSLPDWACTETPLSDPLHPQRRRLGSMAAALAAAPTEASDAVFEHMFTDNVDTAQRLLALDCFAAAACELAGAPSVPPLTAGGARLLLAAELEACRVC
jgi:Telomere length regulation protein